MGWLITSRALGRWAGTPKTRVAGARDGREGSIRAPLILRALPWHSPGSANGDLAALPRLQDLGRACRTPNALLRIFVLMTTITITTRSPNNHCEPSRRLLGPRAPAVDDAHEHSTLPRFFAVDLHTSSRAGSVRAGLFEMSRPSITYAIRTLSSGGRPTWHCRCRK